MKNKKMPVIMRYFNFIKYFSACYMACCCVLFASTAFASPVEEILDQGEGIGLFCGIEEGDYVHVCVTMLGAKQSLIAGGEIDVAAVERLKSGSKVRFTYRTIAAQLEPGSEKKSAVPLLIKIQPLQKQ